MSYFAALNSDYESSDVDEGEKNASIVKENNHVVESSNRQAGGFVLHRIVPNKESNTDLEVDLGFNEEELESCIKVIGVLGKNPNLFKLPKLKALRASLHPLILEQMETNYKIIDEKSTKPTNKNKKRKRTKDDTEDKEALLKKMEREYINQTQLRAIRNQQLQKLNNECDTQVLRVPDGVALLTDAPSQSNMKLLGDKTDVKAEPRKEVHVHNPISCYICKKPFTLLHFFYHQLCPTCAEFNFSKRDEMVDMSGKVCLVTGARAKIGYRCALKLLRCGASVIATTRFPNDAASRYAAESDFSIWGKRIHVYGVDFRDLNSLEALCQYICDNYGRLDAIVNNACQTVRRPPIYYAHLLDGERKLLEHQSAPIREMLINNCEFEEMIKERAGTRLLTTNDAPSTSNVNIDAEENDDITISSLSTKDRPIDNLSSRIQPLSSFEMTQVSLVDGDESKDTNIFPEGATDVNGQQVDMRTKNSWTMRLHEVSTPELAEVFAINAMAPTILNSKLKPLMERDKDALKFIVNVSAMEGKFYRFKNETHPHTNMAKAALNMMTRTSAQDYVKSKIYMTAVDTGWINDEKPITLAVEHEKKHNFQTPIDEIDAASRVLDPIIAPLLAISKGEINVEPPFGLFLKDYTMCEW